MRHLALSLVLLSTLSLHAQSVYDARILEYVGLDHPCDGFVQPVLKIINDGTATMSGCVVETWKNGIQESSFDWQLAVPALEGASRTPAFPVVPAEVGDELELRIISVNGMADEVSAGNIVTLIVSDDVVTTASAILRMEITTDQFPGDLTWSLRNASYQIMAQGGPYLVPATTQETWVTLDLSTCYQLEVRDADVGNLPEWAVRVFGLDQLALEVGPGTWPELDRTGLITGTILGLEDPAATAVPTLFPNPTSGAARLTFNAHTGVPLYGEVLDLSGRTVQHIAVAAGNGSVDLDLSSLQAGRYSIRLFDAEGLNMNTTVVIMK